MREYTEWMGKYEKAREEGSAVQKRWYEIQKRGGTPLEWDKLYTDAESAIKCESRAIAKLREISNKLREVS